MQEMVEKFLNDEKIAGLSRATRRTYRHSLQALVEFSEQYGFPPALVPSKMQEFCVFLLSKKLSGITIKQYITVAKIMYRHYGKPFEFTYRLTAEERKEQRKKRQERWFQEYEVEAILKKSKDNLMLHMVFRLLIETGLRVHELAEIRHENIDLAQRTISIKTTKTEPRFVFFSPDTRYLLGADEFQDPKPFPSVAKLKYMVNNWLTSNGFKKDRDGRGAHTFRHYAATYLYYEGGMILEDVATYLGDTPDVVLKNYLHPTPRMLRKRVDKAMGWL